jgi:hypothetical protein
LPYPLIKNRRIIMANQDTVNQETKETRKKASFRSPSYPRVPLQESVERAKVLYEQESRNPAPLVAVAKDWGYSSDKNGAFNAILASLKYFGLIEYTGSGPNRKARLTELALTIILDKREERYKESLKEACLRPKIHAKLWDDYGNDFPSNETLESQLVMDEGYNDKTVVDVVRNYKESLAFSGLLDEQGSTQSRDESFEDQDGSIEGPFDTVKTEQALSSKQSNQNQGEQELFKFALPGGRSVRILLSGASPTQKDVEKIVALLDLQKDVFPKDGEED